MRGAFQRFCRAVAPHVSAPVDIASLAVFRVLFGALLFAAILRFLARGWVVQLYVAPKFFFPFTGFEWVRPWPGGWMHVHFAALAALALGVAAGFYYRACITLFFLGFTYAELLDKTNYLNHYYFISLMCGLMIFLPANRALSWDAWRRPERRADTVPAWTLNVLRFQVGVVYFFAGVAKLNHDWLWEAQPLRLWLATRSDLPLLGPWLDEAWVAHAASWIGAAFDLSVVFFLLSRRTRRWAYAAVVVFHVMTWLLFRIGMFPWIMIAGAALFFEPDWPRRWWKRRAAPEEPKFAATCNVRWVAALLSKYAAVQIGVPLRQQFRTENSAWSFRGFNFAWNVMVAEKAGFVEFAVRDPASGREWRVRPREHVTPRQELMMAQDPQMIRSLARHIAADFQGRGHPGVEVRAKAYATLNGRPSRPLIDPSANLAGARVSGWILPLEP
ncbi:MAG: HTTM domain-containing protein [Verrucomicrobia bacterium]|nr:HTTM domain-containing protein [Verrucomicrobiota bacterium]